MSKLEIAYFIFGFVSIIYAVIFIFNNFFVEDIGTIDILLNVTAGITFLIFGFIFSILSFEEFRKSI